MNVILLLWVLIATIAFFGILYLDYLKLTKKPEAPYSKYTKFPTALVIIPCRGTDLNMLDNIKSVAGQRYDSFDVVAVVDDAKDTAIGIIKSANIKYIMSDMPDSRASGKVKAILTALKKYPNFDVYVIADSDIIVDNLWLKNIVSPLSDKNIGISTMYPYFNPGQEVWSLVKMVWGFLGEGLMENETTRFGWGGSLAFRRDLLDDQFYNLAQNSVYSVSDDICLTLTAKRKNLKIAYVRESQPRVNSKVDQKAFFEWTDRQTALSILGYKENFKLGILYYGAEIVLFVSAIGLSIFVSPIFIIFFIHYIRNVIVTYSRAKESHDSLLPIIVVIMPFIYFINLIKARKMKGINWRGRYYSIKDTGAPSAKAP